MTEVPVGVLSPYLDDRFRCAFLRVRRSRQLFEVLLHETTCLIVVDTSFVKSLRVPFDLFVAQTTFREDVFRVLAVSLRTTHLVVDRVELLGPLVVWIFFVGKKDRTTEGLLTVDRLFEDTVKIALLHLCKGRFGRDLGR